MRITGNAVNKIKNRKTQCNNKYNIDEKVYPINDPKNHYGNNRLQLENFIIENFKKGTFKTPANIGAKVRITGIKRAIINACEPPYVS